MYIKSPRKIVSCALGRPKTVFRKLILEKVVKSGYLDKIWVIVGK